MYIDEQLCTGCNACVPYCPVRAISDRGGVATIDFDGCVECYNCLRFSNCPAGAIQESPETLQWPRSLRHQFSDASTWHRGTDRGGRGIGGDLKTNDVSGWVRRGEIGIGLEFGRPGVGTRLVELEKMTRPLARIGVRLEPKSQVAKLLADPSTGEMKPEVRDERVLWAVVEVRATPERLADIVPVVREVAKQVRTVISLRVTTRLEDDGSIPIADDLRRLGLAPRPNAKINLGMGRPLVED